MFHAGAGECLKVGISQVVFERGTHIFVSNVDPAYAFIVGGQSDRDMGQPVSWKRMIFTFDSKDALVRS